MNIKKLSLYHYESCPFCDLTRTEIHKLGVNVELRNIQLNTYHLNTLINYGGKSQVPCLLIEYADGTDDWLLESSDIINFLRAYSNKNKVYA